MPAIWSTIPPPPPPAESQIAPRFPLRPAVFEIHVTLRQVTVHQMTPTDPEHQKAKVPCIHVTTKP